MTIKETTAAWAAGLLRTWDAVLEVFGLVRLGAFRDMEGALFAELSERQVALRQARQMHRADQSLLDSVRADLFKAEEELRYLLRYVAKEPEREDKRLRTLEKAVEHLEGEAERYGIGTRRRTQPARKSTSSKGKRK